MKVYENPKSQENSVQHITIYKQDKGKNDHVGLRKKNAPIYYYYHKFQCLSLTNETG